MKNINLIFFYDKNKLKNILKNKLKHKNKHSTSLTL